MVTEISCEVAYAEPDQQTVLSVTAEEGDTVNTVIEKSQIFKRYPQINLSEQAVGIFGKLVTLDHIISEGERIEIYRPLPNDPKQARKQRIS